MTHEVDVAIVTVVYNGMHPECLPSLRRAMDASPCSTRLVVVDNASPDFDTQTFVRTHAPEAVCIARNRNDGFGRGCNRGAAEVSARAYFFLNPDTMLPNEGVIGALWTFLQRYPAAGIAAPRVCYMDGRLQETCRRFPAWYMPLMQRTHLAQTQRGARYRAEFLMQDVHRDAVRPVDWVQGSAFMMDGDLFREIGGFDDRYFMYYEDVDLCRTCWDRGRAVYYLPQTSVSHVYGQGSANTGGIFHSMFRNKLARAHVSSWLRYTRKWGTKLHV
ncbi:MAG: glycosyltransferase family 2 protein [Patescibacteria group bacterium]